jgi:hypothetical protein
MCADSRKDNKQGKGSCNDKVSEIESKFAFGECTIVRNSDYGIYIAGNARVDFGSLGHNYVYGNGKYDFYNGTRNVVNAKENYWGTMNFDVCMEHIYDYLDDSSLGAVLIYPLWNGNYESEGTMESGEDKTALRNHLHSASPSLFHENTTIDYSIANPGYISLCIYDISGRLVRTLCSKKKTAGIYRIIWNGCDNSNSKVSTGVYFIQLVSEDFTYVQKVMVVR